MTADYALAAFTVLLAVVVLGGGSLLVHLATPRPKSDTAPPFCVVLTVLNDDNPAPASAQFVTTETGELELQLAIHKGP